MRQLRLPILFLLGVVALGTIATGVAVSQFNVNAHLSGRNEVPPIETRGQGQANFKIARDETSISFKLIATNIQGVTQAHIHCGPAGANGPVVAFLYGLNPAGVSPRGILSQGTITNADVIPRPDSAVCPGGVADLDGLIEQIRAGNAYVNVHTIANPPGEIRGQID